MNKFTFKYIPHKNLGRLVWGAVIKRHLSTIRVYIGDAVEATSDYFVAGVWDGDFKKGNFDEAEFFCGSGAKLAGGGVKIISASHERERILLIKKEGKIYISNSIPMILAISKERLDIKCDQYERILCSIVDGLKDYQKSVPLASGTKMYQIFCKDVLIDYECNIKFQRRPIHTDFVSYEHYYNSLLEVCKKIRDNGQDTLRKNKYGLITTVSSGYDSSAASAIAYELGCKTACTFCGGNYDADSGIEVAKQLGYKKIIQKSGNEYKSKSSMTDARCVCNGDMGSNLQFTAFEDVFAGNIVFVGICGDTVYSKDAIPNTDLKRYGVPFYQANMSYIETALADGYIVLPMPLYALTAHASIQRITNSKEMEPWTLHNTYDRPIPRRICETHGVERTVFGNEKHGAGISLSRNFTRKQIKSKLTVSGYEEFMEWLSKKGNNTWHFKRIVHLLKYHYCILPEYIDYLKAKLHLKCKGHSYNKRANLYANPCLPSRLVIWGIEKITSDYRVVIKK